MSNDIENVLNNLKNNSRAIIYTEVFLEEIERRNILEDMVDEFLLFRKAIEIRQFCNLDYRFEIHYAWNNVNNLVVVADVFNRKKLILISAFPKRRRDSFYDFDNSEIRMKMTYDQPYGMITLCILDGFRYGQTIAVGEGLYIDFDAYGYPISLTLFGVSKRFTLRASEFLNCRMEGVIEITEDLIRVRVEVTVKLKKVVLRVIEKEISNDFGILPNHFVLKIDTSNVLG